MWSNCMIKVKIMLIRMCFSTIKVHVTEKLRYTLFKIAYEMENHELLSNIKKISVQFGHTVANYKNKCTGT